MAIDTTLPYDNSLARTLPGYIRETRQAVVDFVDLYLPIELDGSAGPYTETVPVTSVEIAYVRSDASGNLITIALPAGTTYLGASTLPGPSVQGEIMELFLIGTVWYVR